MNVWVYAFVFSSDNVKNEWAVCDNWLDLKGCMGNAQSKVRDHVCQSLIFVFDW